MEVVHPSSGTALTGREQPRRTKAASRHRSDLSKSRVVSPVRITGWGAEGGRGAPPKGAVSKRSAPSIGVPRRSGAKRSQARAERPKVLTARAGPGEEPP